METTPSIKRVQFDGSDEWINSPFTDPDEAARWAFRLASGRDPGKLYVRKIADTEMFHFWSRRKLNCSRRLIVADSET